MKAKLKVLMTTSVFPKQEDDATPAFVQNLATDLVAAGHEVLVIAPHFKRGPRKTVENGVTVLRFAYAWPSGLQTLCYGGGMLVQLKKQTWKYALLPLFLFYQRRCLRITLKTFQPDILHAHSILPQGWIAATALDTQNGIPLIVSSHGNDVFGLRNKFDFFKRQTTRKASFIVCNSKATKHVAKEFCSETKCKIIPASPNHASNDHRIALNPTKRRDPSPTLLFAGRLIPEKGIDLLVNVFPEVLKSTPNARLLVCGDGPLAHQLKKIVEAHSLEKSISLLGWIPNNRVAEYFSIADFVVVPSQLQESGWNEAQGLVAVEAMAASKPVIASKIGGLKESIIHGETGLLVEPGNADALVDAMVNLLQMPHEQRNVWGQRGREIYEAKFSRATITQKTIDLYYRSLSRKAETQDENDLQEEITPHK